MCRLGFMVEASKLSSWMCPRIRKLIYYLRIFIRRYVNGLISVFCISPKFLIRSILLITYLFILIVPRTLLCHVACPSFLFKWRRKVNLWPDPEHAAVCCSLFRFFLKNFFIFTPECRHIFKRLICGCSIVIIDWLN